MSDRYHIRAGDPDDVAIVVALDRATDLLPHWSEGEYIEAISDPEQEESAEVVSRCLFVAENDSGIVGFAVAKAMRLPSEVLAELESLAVAASERRAGIGGALCKAAIEWSRREGAAEMDLEVRSRSAGAIALYAELGFALTGRRGAYYRDPVDDALLMRMILRDAHGERRGKL